MNRVYTSDRCGSLMMKFPWWRKADAPLEITGRRLDATAPPLRVEIGRSGDVHMVPTYINFSDYGMLGSHWKSE